MKRALIPAFLLVFALILAPRKQGQTQPCSCPCPCPSSAEQPIIMTWNVIRDYPESIPAKREWFSGQLVALAPDILAVQEIANQEKIDDFLANQTSFEKVAFKDSSDGQDNAIFATSKVSMENLSDPEGFQHPAQSAYFFYQGFDAVIITVHLSWTDVERREQEKDLLRAYI